MSLNLDCSRLEGLLGDELDFASRLLHVMQLEHDAVGRRDVDKLQQAVVDKQRLLDQLESCHSRRTMLLQDVGLSTDRQGFEALLLQCEAAGSDLGAAWAAVKEALQACQRQNQINGKVLESSRRGTHLALSLLLGGQGEGTELYTQEGKSSLPPLGGRTVNKA